METDSQLIVDNFPPFIRTYKDGRVERLLTSSYVPASEDPAAGRGVATRDVVINRGTGVSARLFLPVRAAAAAAGRRLPLVIYFHGGSFCTESAFCRTYHRYATSLAASAGALVVSVEYRLAPEHPIPAAYDDAWDALRWASSPPALSDPWIAADADPQRAFLAGDSAGGNIVYHTAVRAAREGGAGVLDVLGLVMVQPYFWGPEWLPSETVWDGVAVFPAALVDELWPFVTRSQAGNDDPRINPPDEEIATLRCRRVLVAVAEKDTLVHRGRALAARVRENPWIGGDNVTVVESEGEDHGFHLYSPLRATSKRLMKAVTEFINQPETVMTSTPPTAAALLDQHRRYRLHEFEDEAPKTYHWGLSVPTRPFHSIVARGADMKVGSSMASNSLKTTWHGKTTTPKTSNGSFLNRARIGKGSMNPLPATFPGSFAMKRFF